MLELDLCVALSTTKTPYGRTRQGLCSRYLVGLEPGSIVALHLTTGLISPPALDKPLILVGPGTGLAPMRAILQYKNAVGGTGNVFLFYGCRKQEHDCLYRHEWQEHFTNHTLNGDDSALVSKKNAAVVVSIACSRDKFANAPSAAREGVYVTDKISVHGKTLWGMMQSGQANIIISGSAKRMPRDVRKALLNIVLEHGGLSLDDAEKYLQIMAKRGQYVVETWS